MYRIGQDEIEEVKKVIDSGKLFKINSGLQEVFHAEEEMKAKFGCKKAILMTSGQAALTSALIGMGIGPGDEVIIPAYTYIATAMSVLAVRQTVLDAQIGDIGPSVRPTTCAPRALAKLIASSVRVE